MSLSQNDINFINDNYLTMSDREIGECLNHPKATICSYRKRVKLVVSKEETIRRRVKTMTGRSSSTQEIDKIIHDSYLTVNVNQLSIKVGRSETFIKIRMRQLGLVIPQEIIEQRKIDSRIKKGNVPQNKGKKQIEYMSPEAIARTAGTRFKPGQTVHNEGYDGEIRIRTDHEDRSARPYKWIRISKGHWEHLHRVMWIEKNGPVPEKHLVVFKDGDSLNCTLENLELISMAENAIRNSNHDNPTDSRIAFYLSTRSRKVNVELKKELMRHPNLLEAKRQQLLLKRLIKNERRINPKARTAAE